MDARRRARAGRNYGIALQVPPYIPVDDGYQLVTLSAIWRVSIELSSLESSFKNFISSCIELESFHRDFIWKIQEGSGMKILILIISMGVVTQSFTQEPGIHPETEEMVLNESEDNDEENDRLQQLHAFRRKPLDLNEASTDELQMLGLTVFHILALIEHRKRFGDLIAIQELQAVKGWD